MTDTTTTHTVATTESPLITINQIRLSGKQLWAIAATIIGLLGSGFAGGYIFMPAKAVDLTAVRAVVESVRVEQVQMRQTVASLTSQTAQLSDAVDGLRLAVDALPRRRADVAPEKRRKVVKVQKKRPAAATAVAQKGGLFSGL